jgi:hypothetical protein
MLRCSSFRQDPGVAALAALGHGLADKGERLVTVESAQFDDPTVEREALVRELGVAKAECGGYLRRSRVRSSMRRTRTVYKVG